MLFSGVLIGRIGFYKYWFLVGGALSTTGNALMLTVTPSTPLPTVYGFSVLLAAGNSLYIQATFALAQAEVSPQEAPDAVSIMGCTQLGAIAMSLAVANSIFVNRAANAIEPILPGLPRTTVQAAISGVAAQVIRDLPDALKNRVVEEVSKAIQDAWTQILATAALSLLLSLFMKKKKARVHK